MENIVCKKCGKKLPQGYKYKKCEACRSVQVQKTKEGLKAAAGVVAGVVVAIVTKGKIKPKK